MALLRRFSLLEKPGQESFSFRRLAAMHVFPVFGIAFVGVELHSTAVLLDLELLSVHLLPVLHVGRLTIKFHATTGKLGHSSPSFERDSNHPCSCLLTMVVAWPMFVNSTI